ncbi:hypothetical protein ACRS3T_28250 [Burkholderia cenocepacia]
MKRVLLSCGAGRARELAAGGVVVGFGVRGRIDRRGEKRAGAHAGRVPARRFRRESGIGNDGHLTES